MMYAFIGRGLVMIYRNYDYFLTIVKTGSLTKAAEILYITQPSLSKYLSRLEENLNIQLFDRSRSRKAIFGIHQYDYPDEPAAANEL